MAEVVARGAAPRARTLSTPEAFKVLNESLSGIQQSRDEDALSNIVKSLGGIEGGASPQQISEQLRQNPRAVFTNPQALAAAFSSIGQPPIEESAGPTGKRTTELAKGLRNINNLNISREEKAKLARNLVDSMKEDETAEDALARLQREKIQADIDKGESKSDVENRKAEADIKKTEAEIKKIEEELDSGNLTKTVEAYDNESGETVFVTPKMAVKNPGRYSASFKGKDFVQVIDNKSGKTLFLSPDDLRASVEKKDGKYSAAPTGRKYNALDTKSDPPRAVFVTDAQINADPERYAPLKGKLAGKVSISPDGTVDLSFGEDVTTATRTAREKKHDLATEAVGTIKQAIRQMESSEPTDFLVGGTLRDLSNYLSGIAIDDIPFPQREMVKTDLFTFRESLMKSIRTGDRFSDNDVDRMLEIFPDPTLFGTSLAQGKIRTLELFGYYVRRYAETYKPGEQVPFNAKDIRMLWSNGVWGSPTNQSTKDYVKELINKLGMAGQIRREKLQKQQ